MNQYQFVHGLSALRPEQINADGQGCVATIGTFDGVHLGHRQLLESVMSKAREYSLPSVVMIFEPQPYEFFARDEAPSRLSRLREKVYELLSLGIDKVVCLKFNEALRSLSAEEYIERVLVKGLAVKHLIIGDDFRFGCDRAGDFNKLKQAGEQYGFSVEDTKTLSDSGERISSTRIRQLLAENRLADAERILGRPYSIFGKVVYGNQLGRQIGFPTANVALGRFRSPVNGVFAVTLETRDGFGAREYQGVANVGMRPSIDGDGRRKKKPILEVHLFGFDGDLYGNYVSVVFQRKIRDEKKFESLEALQKQIAIDTEEAKRFFADNFNDSTLN
ncbi:bifunctional riboflavin kinase/FAD synthetase [Teredinibacter sp. KSP-S5-2]|uniref:bifunctional riboflavin kinase/FAD synthetase n=1 Tax=Teredinibacter sp. KSP-S5-2 TaxID=3034506 RepID=UPI002934C4C4|nr:bifunctional riboflavin kinase/FAD synthetase [Teredinibacter sp. KSP-S5-2]WNO09856.1 bifunctional riboflavin kinase/FAD synthetase [Teredinibacter sp. KSP-S5-2]